MIKTAEEAFPNSCLNKALPDEMLFILLARDPAAPAAIRAWIVERERLGLNTPGDQKLSQALHCAAEMKRQHPVIRSRLTEAALTPVKPFAIPPGQVIPAIEPPAAASPVGYAVEVISDGHGVRCEGPTAEEVIRLMGLVHECESSGE